jgi:hypothetical protein
MDFHKVLNKMNVQALLCFFLVTAGVAQSAHADGRYRVNVIVLNGTATPLVLSGANWVVTPDGTDDYAIPAHNTGNFGLRYASKKKGQFSFRYTAGQRSCTFKGGHDTKYSFGWLKAKEEPYQWSDAQSDGVLGAVCKARIVSSQPDKDYTVSFSLE